MNVETTGYAEVGHRNPQAFDHINSSSLSLETLKEILRYVMPLVDYSVYTDRPGYVRVSLCLQYNDDADYAHQLLKQCGVTSVLAKFRIGKPRVIVVCRGSLT